MIEQNVELRLFIKGRPITEFPHEGKIYVEGRSGSDFEIEINNRNPFRIEAVISVDGLSITSGKAAGVSSTGYLLDAYQTVRIPGWKLNSDQVAKFVFAGRGASYADAVGDSNNNGVIGLMAFREKPRPRVATLNNVALGSTFRGMTKGMASASASTSGSLSTSSTPSYNAAVQQSLGTGFGAAQEFATRQVSFDRGDRLVTTMIYYDDLRGLKARGVPMERVSKTVYQPAPQAFPEQGCTPPPGWQG